MFLKKDMHGVYQEPGLSVSSKTEQKMCAKGESNPRHSYIFAMAKLYFTTKPLALADDGHRKVSLLIRGG